MLIQLIIHTHVKTLLGRIDLVQHPLVQITQLLHCGFAVTAAHVCTHAVQLAEAPVSRQIVDQRHCRLVLGQRAVGVSTLSLS